MRLNIFHIILFLLFTNQLSAQRVIHYTSGEGTQDQMNPHLWILYNKVRATHEDMIFFSDSAILNQQENHFTAYRNIKIIINDSLFIYGDNLFYNASTKIVNIKGNVRLIDKEMVLTTKELFYDRNTSIAYYLNYGITEKDSSTLNSVKGYYHSNTKDFYYFDSVVLNNDSGIIYSDTLRYNTNTNDIVFNGPTQVFSDSIYVYCEYGYYNTDTQKLKASKNTYMKNESQTIIADHIHYDRSIEFGKALQNVIITDSSNSLIITGHFAEMDRLNHYSFVTDSAVMKVFDENNDTLFLYADTLYAYSDTNQSYKHLYAYHHVKFFRDDVQGSCDSLYYNVDDSTAQMYTHPIIWIEGRQFTSDTMTFLAGNDGIKEFELINSAFIISKGDSAEFDQVKGLYIKGYFKEGELDYVDVEGNSESVYYIREDEDENLLQPLVGVNVGKGEKMKIYFEDKKPIKILTFKDPTMRVYPPQEVPPEYQYMDGFKWIYESRPKSKFEIFPIPVAIEEEKKD